MKIGEDVEVKGKKVAGGNLFEYRNVTLSSGVGDKSCIDMCVVDGKMVGKGCSGSAGMLVGEKGRKTAIPAA
ncbi:hypothetical protein, partial [Paenibacillus xylanexedens]|uniref:hypothetical protein n=1 Tax=Paenibacillus xylanexedens TaxID=528191 RepID=UPI0011A41218